MRLLPLVLCAVAMLGGCAAVLAWGLHPPVYIAEIESVLLASAALLYGYTAHLPSLPRWLGLKPVRGAALVALGIGVMYVPAELILRPS